MASFRAIGSSSVQTRSAPRLRLPVQGEVEVTREDLPSGNVVPFDEVALGMGSDLHRISLGAAEYAGFPERRSPLPAATDRPPDGGTAHI
jgi:hypothetical protein